MVPVFIRSTGILINNLAKTVHKPQRGEANFDLPMLFCACSVQNTPGASEIRNTPGRLSQKNKKFYPQTCFGAHAGCGDVTSLCKNLVKNRKTNFRRQAIQEPIFPVANIDFEGGCDGRGCGVRHFFGQIGPTQPYGIKEN
jgi:hypothetical protein